MTTTWTSSGARSQETRDRGVSLDCSRTLHARRRQDDHAHPESAPSPRRSPHRPGPPVGSLRPWALSRDIISHTRTRDTPRAPRSPPPQLGGRDLEEAERGAQAKAGRAHADWPPWGGSGSTAHVGHSLSRSVSESPGGITMAKEMPQRTQIRRLAEHDSHHVDELDVARHARAPTCGYGTRARAWRCRRSARTRRSTSRAAPERVVDINALSALAPFPAPPSPRTSRPQPHTPPPAGAAGTAFCLRCVAESLPPLQALRPVTPGFAALSRLLDEVSFINASGLERRGSIRGTGRAPLAFFERPE